MEKSHLINIELNNIRAVKSANIILDGITVISGENGCGKSTISKLTYHLFKTSIEYEDIIDKGLRREYSRVYRTLDQLTRELSYVVDRDEYLKIRRSYRQLYKEEEISTQFSEGSALNVAINYLIDVFTSISEDVLNNPGLNIRLERVRRILKDSSGKTDDFNIEELLINTKNQLKSSFRRAAVLKESRPKSILIEKLDDAFIDSSIPNTFNLYEYGVPIIDNKEDKVLPIHSIEKVAYIDTPMVIGVETFSDRLHWGDLDALLALKKPFEHNKNIDRIFKDEILKGEAKLEDKDLSPSDFTYKRKDGKEFDLLECATGLKSFSVLQLLYKNGFLTEKTLLIIDEPEVHLHPQWVVEYARLIVLLNKVFGVKFLIASHHPDMISAIKYISEKEQTNDTLHFYLASEEKGTFTYNYKDLGVEIDDIFSSFNIALDRIDQYGQTE